MITSVQLAQALTRNLVEPDFAKLPLGEQQRVQHAAQHAWNIYLSLLPFSQRHRPVSAPMPAPLTLSLDVTSGFSALAYHGGSPFPVGGYDSETALLGQSVILPGDARVNRLVRSAELLGPYRGSTGTAAGVFYADALALDVDQVRVVQPPSWLVAGASRPLPLTHLDNPQGPAQSAMSGMGCYPFQSTPSIGQPRFWWTEPATPSESVALPTWQVRVWPLPADAGQLLLTLDSLPPALTLLDMTVPRPLPIADRVLPLLLNIAEPMLLTSPLLAPTVDKGLIISASVSATGQLAALVQIPQHSNGNQVGTPANY